MTKKRLLENNPTKSYKPSQDAANLTQNRRINARPEHRLEQLLKVG